MKRKITQKKNELNTAGTIYFGVFHPSINSQNDRDHKIICIMISEKVSNHHALLEQLKAMEHVIDADYNSKLSEYECVRNCEEVHQECTWIDVIMSAPDIISLETMKSVIEDYFITLVKTRNETTEVKQYPEHEDEGEPASLAFY